MCTDPDAPLSATGDPARRLIRGLAALDGDDELSWARRLGRLLEIGIDVLPVDSAVLTQANEDHHWVVASAGHSERSVGDRLEPGDSFHSAPHERTRLLFDPATGRLGAPVTRGGDPWGSLTFSNSSGAPEHFDEEVEQTLSLLATWLSRDITLRHVEAELHRSRQHLGHLVHIDPLTELLNKRGAADAFDSFVRRSGFEGKPLSYLICGLSGMQKINDRFGRQTGDRVVRAVARSLRSSLRPGDVSARLGRYELLGILPGASLTAARSVAERVLTSINDLRLHTRDGDHVVPTVRVGVARVTLDQDGFDHVMSEVGPLLRQAHQSGEIAVASGLFVDRKEAG